MLVDYKRYSLLLLLTLLVYQVNARFYQSTASLKCLDDQAILKDCIGDQTQKWDVKSNGQIYNRYSKTCLDAAGNNSVYLSKCKEVNSQKWKEAQGQLKNMEFDLCLHPKDKKPPNVELVDCGGRSDLGWTSIPVRRLVNRAFKKCLEDVGSKAILESCKDKESQYWEVLDFGVNNLIRNKGTKRCLDVKFDTKKLVYLNKCQAAKSHPNWLVTPKGEIKNRYKLDLNLCMEPKNPNEVYLEPCPRYTKDVQVWDPTVTRMYVNKASQKCLEEGGSKARIANCVVTQAIQTWEMRGSAKLLYSVNSGYCLTVSEDANKFYTYDCWVPLMGERRLMALSSGQIKDPKTLKCLRPKNLSDLDLQICNKTKSGQIWDRKKGSTINLY